MLTLPSVHPFLKTLLTESSSERDQPTIPTHDSWKTIVEEAITQRITPLLLGLFDHPVRRHQIPLHWLTILKQQVVQHTAWNLLLTNELRAILALCGQRNIACIPIRGPVLAEHLYGAGSTRQMDDLDILVHHGDLSAVKDIFQQRGYAHHEQRPGFLEAFSYSLEFIHLEHGLVVEPHWTLAYPPFIGTAAMEPVWARAGRQRWMEMDTWALSHEDLLLHLCLHVHHKGQQAPLLWFHELATMIRWHGSTLDWNMIVEQARLMEQAGAVADVLTILIGEFRAIVPDSVTRSLADQPCNTPSPSPSTLRNQILAQSSRTGREEFALLSSLQSRQEQLRYLSALLFPSSQYMTRRYGASTRMCLIGWYITRFFLMGAEGLRCVVAWIGTLIATRSSSSIRK